LHEMSLRYDLGARREQRTSAPLAPSDQHFEAGTDQDALTWRKATDYGNARFSR
jgi:hypothetical protein